MNRFQSRFTTTWANRSFSGATSTSASNRREGGAGDWTAGGGGRRDSDDGRRTTDDGGGLASARSSVVCRPSSVVTCVTVPGKGNRDCATSTSNGQVGATGS